MRAPNKKFQYEGAFLYIALIIFFITAALKTVSLIEGAKVLSAVDYVFSLKLQTMYVLIVAIEISIIAAIIFGQEVLKKLMLIFCFASCAASYHLVIILMKVPHPCPCLGSATAWWPWLDRNQGWVLSLLISFLFGGSSYFGIKRTVTLMKRQGAGEAASGGVL